MPKICLDIIMYVFEAIFLYNYAEDMFYSSKKKSLKFFASIAINIFLCVIYQFEIIGINFISMFLLYLLVLHFIYSFSLKYAVFHTIIFMSIMSASELAVISICNLIYDDFSAMHTESSAYVLVVVSSKIIFFSIMMVIKKFFVIKYKQKVKDKLFGLLFFVPLTGVITLIIFYYIAINNEINALTSILLSINSVSLLVASIIVFVVHERFQKNAEELYELQSINFQQEVDKKYFEVIEQSNDEIKHFSHDIKNHLLQIRYIDDIEETHKYLDRLITDVEKISYVGISENKMLNLIVSKYISICEKKGIKFTPSVKLANLSYINDVDLSTLLNNLLDNSVDAAEKSANSEIELYVFSKNSRYDGVIIRNTCVNPPESVGGRLITSKKEKAYHGLGLNIVKKIVKKYDALYDWKYDDNKHIFETDIAIPKQHREGKKKNGV
ncbi:MAG: GHKL domain-containing protein [Clostridia bacterium]|nr:GHKL domain-containing protein [Clostridia bacterium]